MATSHFANIVIHAKSAEQRRKAEILSQRSGLPIRSTPGIYCKYNLVYTDNCLELQQNPHFKEYRFSPTRVDLHINGKIHPRIRTTSIKDPLPRALGVKRGIRPSVLDCTAGLGLDGFSLAWIGCKVTLVERSPIIFALLEDGLIRAAEHPHLHKIIKENITLLYKDANTYLKQTTAIFDSVYIDPMFPGMDKGPKNKKEMRVLRDLVGDDIDSSKLLYSAFSSRCKRIVVKRPKGSAFLSDDHTPSHRILMKSGRFDIYFPAYL